jgi:photosynthetic reaction center H subunit
MVMMNGAVGGYIDVAQLVLYAFWTFFAGLILYLRREDKREGYPLESDRSAGAGRVRVQGFPAMPAPKTFKLADGREVLAPREEHDSRPIMARPLGSYPGAPLVPTGNPMLDAVGPAAYAERSNHPDRTLEAEAMIVPMRVALGMSVAAGDPDPRGWSVIGADRESGGTVSDLWVDRTEPQIRYFEVQVSAAKRVLLPVTFAKIDADRQCINVQSILGAQFAQVPALSNPDEVTLREEDRIAAYYASGKLYATPARAEPFI